MATPYGINYGAVVSTGENALLSQERRLRSQDDRQHNALLKKYGEKDRRAARRTAETGYQHREAVMAGQPGAAQAMMTWDPEEYTALQNAITNLDAQQRDAMARKVEESGKIAAGILNVPEADRANVYAKLIKRPEFKDLDLPKKYDEDELMFTLGRLEDTATAIERIQGQDQISVEQFGGEDLLVRGGNRIEDRAISMESLQETRLAAAAEVGGNAIREMSAADENAMLRQVLVINDGLMDQNGEITLLDPMKASLIQETVHRASVLYATDPTIVSISQAVNMAAQELGTRFPDGSGQTPPPQQGGTGTPTGRNPGGGPGTQRRNAVNDTDPFKVL